MCTNPNFMMWTGELTLNNRPKLKFLGKQSYDKLLEYKLPFIQVPCGQCLECRLQQTRQWADRCVLEAQKYKDNYFITLTYDDAHLPANNSLRPDDVVKFLKKLRYKFKDTKIRVLYCGEYGDQSFRPHYHLLLFNCPLNDVCDVFQMYDEEQKRYINYLRPSNSHIDTRWSRTIYDLWTDGKTKEHLGNIAVGAFNFDTAAYCAQYCMKKALKPNIKEFYEEVGLVPEFIRVSNRPGIGADYFHEHDDGVFATHLIVPCPGDAHKAVVPRYFDKLFIKKYGEDVFIPIRARRLKKREMNIETYTHNDKKQQDADNRLRDYKLRKRQILRNQI